MPCAGCGAANGLTATRCWQCDAELPRPPHVERPAAPTRPAHETAAPAASKSAAATPKRGAGARNNGRAPHPRAPRSSQSARNLRWKLAAILAGAVLLQLAGYYYESEAEQDEIQARLAALQRPSSARPGTLQPAGRDEAEPAVERVAETLPAPRRTAPAPQPSTADPAAPALAKIAATAPAQEQAAPAAPAAAQAEARTSIPFAAAVVSAAAALPREGSTPPEVPARHCNDVVAVLGLCAPDLPPKGDSP